MHVRGTFQAGAPTPSAFIAIDIILLGTLLSALFLVDIAMQDFNMYVQLSRHRTYY